MSNNFKDKRRRETYDSYVNNFINKTYLFHNGEEYRGSSDRHAFWAGYHGWFDSRMDSAYKASITYPIYRAGKDCAKLEGPNNV